ncbi:coenzyme F420-0:L-glutamate ligase [Actinopolymorpha alba]|uniref:coenzyme F420-0:L-glutamate ligase n=1 Tax=Actinopolymorpha alba TaxID=533267 RepID=UPI00036D258F|nr:coenzyme F420-0:L-glutamate ligase [Actinopolymorpha alba]
MTAAPPPGSFVVRPVHGMPEVRAGDDLAALIHAHAPELRDGDILVVSSKIVSKAEGRLVPGTDRSEAIRSETVRVVAERGTTQIVQTRHGFVMAAAGVDASNVEAGSLLLLPEDPDASARSLRRGLSALTNARLGVIITDTFGRPWRLGQVDLAIGASGVRPFDDHRGRADVHGNELAVTAPAHADELAAAAELAKGKLGQVPVAIVRGLPSLVTEDDGPGVGALVRPADSDMFRLGSREARREAVTLPRTVPELADAPVDPDAVGHVGAAVSAVVATATPAGSWGLVEVASADVLKPLVDAVGLPSSVSYAVLLYVRAGDAARRTSALLELGGIRDRLALSCTVEGLGSVWLAADRLDRDAVRRLLPDTDTDTDADADGGTHPVAGAEPIGLLAVGALA